MKRSEYYTKIANKHQDARLNARGISKIWEAIEALQKKSCDCNKKSDLQKLEEYLNRKLRDLENYNPFHNTQIMMGYIKSIHDTKLIMLEIESEKE